MFTRVRELIQAGMVEHALPSVAVAVARGGEVVWEEAFGWADRERRVPATLDTCYSLASISKPITATGLMVLVERGLIDLDRPINDYLGEATLSGRAGDVAEATVRRVANHTSGLSLHYQFFSVGGVRHRPSMDETIRRYGSLVTAPGERYQYSNLGYGVLDYVIERVSGRPYAEFMREEVFQPLALFHTSVDIAPGLEPFAATRYTADGLPIPFYTFDHPGASAVFASARDLLRFGMFHLGQRLPDQKAILTSPTLAEMRQVTTTPVDNRGYGVGWRTILDDMGVVSFGHDGGMGGVKTTLRMVPSEGIVVVALTNSGREGGVIPYGLPEEILSDMLPDYAACYEQRKVEGFVAGQMQTTDLPPFVPAPELTGEWRGSVRTMAGERPLALWIHDDGDVIAQYNRQLRSLVNDVAVVDRQLTGRFLGDIETPDCSYRPHHLHLDLRPRAGVLEGALMAISAARDSGAPGRRAGYALNHWARLERVAR